MTKKHYIFILVHADIWGALNANRLVKGIAAYSRSQQLAGRETRLVPLLFVSYSTKNKSGAIAVGKNPSLSLIREVKEDRLKTYFDQIHAIQTEHTGKLVEPRCLTFEGLAKKYCADREVHFIDSGGAKGATQMLMSFGELEKKRIKPKLVLSGDTLSFVPGEIIKRYPCFGTHPGPLPHVPGMHATLRSVLYRQFYHANGTSFYPFFEGRPCTSWHDIFRGLPHVAGTFFNLREKLDEGPPIDFIYTPYQTGMSLVDLRHDVYDALTRTMLAHLPKLLDPSSRKKILAKKSEEHQERRAKLPLSVPVLEEHDLQALLKGDGHAIGAPIDLDGEALEDNSGVGIIEAIRPALLSPASYLSSLKDFWPRGHFDECSIIGAYEAGLLAGKLARAFDETCLELFPDLAAFENNTLERYEFVGYEQNPDGSQRTVIDRNVWPVRGFECKI